MFLGILLLPLFVYYATIPRLEASLRLHCCVTSGWHNIAVLRRFLVFVFSFVIVLVFVHFPRCNFYVYIVFVSQIFIILFFVLTKRRAIILVFVFVMKIVLGEAASRVKSPI